MQFTRAKAVTAATIAALSGLTAVALASNDGSTPTPTAAAPTTPIIEHRTEVVDRTVHRTKTVNDDAGGKVTSVRTTTDRADRSPQAAPAQQATRASAPVAQRPPAAPVTAPVAEHRDDDRGEDREDDHGEDHGEDREDDDGEDREDDHGDDDGDDD